MVQMPAFLTDPLIDLACSTRPIAKQRAKVVPQAHGHVLELGIGSGHNLAHYDPVKVTRVTGVDPSVGLGRKAARRAQSVVFGVDHVQITGEDFVPERHAYDTILVTYTLCSIPDAVRALSNLRRGLKPGGWLLFCEHGRAPDAAVSKWQDRVNPLWRPLSGGCNMNRAITPMLQAAGWSVEQHNQKFLPKTPRILGWNEWGSATPS